MMLAPCSLEAVLGQLGQVPWTPHTVRQLRQASSTATQLHICRELRSQLKVTCDTMPAPDSTCYIEPGLSLKGAFIGQVQS
jgi:hypothetical protein